MLHETLFLDKKIKKLIESSVEAEMLRDNELFVLVPQPIDNKVDEVRVGNRRTDSR